MLRVKIELWPGGQEANKRDMGTLTIANDGSGDQDMGNYAFSISKWENKGIWKQGEVKGFNRIKFGAWDLLFRVLREALGFRNGDRIQGYEVLTDSTVECACGCGIKLEVKDRNLSVSLGVSDVPFKLPENVYLVRKV